MKMEKKNEKTKLETVAKQIIYYLEETKNVNYSEKINTIVELMENEKWVGISSIPTDAQIPNVDTSRRLLTFLDDLKSNVVNAENSQILSLLKKLISLLGIKFNKPRLDRSIGCLLGYLTVIVIGRLWLTPHLSIWAILKAVVLYQFGF